MSCTSDTIRPAMTSHALNLQDKKQFDEKVNLNENNSMLNYVLQRMKGGSKVVDIDTQRAAILVDLPTYQLVPSGHNKNLKIPNRPVCRKYKVCGAKDDRCRFHTCPSCGQT
ncbi:hypothetical protein I4U23_015158 [Adineta vaga]|nr:hypothetical protein I4U23_015158 [Adineta vaga]